MKAFTFPTNHHQTLWAFIATADMWLLAYFRLLHVNFRRLHSALHPILALIGLMGVYTGIRLDLFQVIEFLMRRNHLITAVCKGFIDAPCVEMIISSLLFAPFTLNVIKLGFEFYRMKDYTPCSLMELFIKCLGIL